MTRCEQRSTDSNSSKLESLISKWVVRFALNAGVALDAPAQANYRVLWLEGFSDLAPDRLEAAFAACLRSHVFKNMPTIADVRQHLQKAQGHAADEEASRKWDRVREYIRLHYSADGIQAKNHKPGCPRRGCDCPSAAAKISERTRRAINAAGGMASLSECIGTDLAFARQRFIESYLRWDELKQGEYLLPEGELKKILADVAQNKVLPSSSPSFAELHARGLAYAKQLEAPRPRILPTAVPEPVRVVDVEGRRRELARQAELIKAKYSQREAAQA